MVDNGGGGIFSYLPPSELPEFEQLFSTPHNLDLVEIATAHGAAAERVDDVSKLGELLVSPQLTESGRLRVFVVQVDRDAALARHRELWDAVATVVGDQS